MYNISESVQNHIATMETYFGKRDFQAAINEAKTLYRKGQLEEDLTAISYSARTMMKAYYQLGDYHQSFHYGGMLLDMLEDMDELFLNSVYQFLAILFYELKEYDEAIGLLEVIGQAALEADDHIHLFEAYIHLSTIYSQSGEYHLGFKYAQKASRLVPRFGEHMEFIEYALQTTLFEAYLCEGNISKIKQCLDKLDQLSEAVSSDGDLKYYYENYAKYYDLIGDYKAYMNMARAGYDLSVRMKDGRYRKIFLDMICKHIDYVETGEERLEFLKKFTNMTMDDQTFRIYQQATHFYAKYHAYLQRVDGRYDALTGCLNRQVLDRDISRIGKKDSMVCFLFDIDDFKIINDTYGHMVGDEILQKVSHHLRTSLKEVGKLYRYGGDEFVLLIREGSESFIDIAEEILDSFRSISCEWIGVPITTSIGIATTDDVENGYLLEAADKAMYKAKGQGKGRYVIGG